MKPMNTVLEEKNAKVYSIFLEGRLKIQEYFSPPFHFGDRHGGLE